MASRSEQNRQRAKDLEDRLKNEGRFADAQIVAKVRKTASSAIGTCKLLHRDNMELRQKLGLPSYLDEKFGGKNGKG